MYKIATIVAYAFYLYYFKNTTIAAYAGLRVKNSCAWVTTQNALVIKVGVAYMNECTQIKAFNLGRATDKRLQVISNKMQL